MSDKKNIVFVSIACDLYGSSKVLLSLVLHMKNQSNRYNPIVCLPPEEGPLRAKLQEAGVQIIEMPVVKLTRSMLRSFGVFKLWGEYRKAKRIFKDETNDITVDYIHSNTLATLFGAIYCKFRKTKHIIHVHEIMDRPKAATHFFKRLIKHGCDVVVFNSEATAKFYNSMGRSIRKKSATIPNGVARPTSPISEEEKRQIREELFGVSEEDIVIGLVGRFNRLKGHDITLKVFTEISEAYPKLKLLFVGSPPPGQEHFLDNLREKIKTSTVSDKVKIVGFQEKVFPLMESMDLVVVPSTEPESFGLVVVEAMFARRAVVGSRIGGISTIINHEKTGLLFDHESTEDYKENLKKLLDNPVFKKELEANALEMATRVFTTDVMYEKFLEMYNNVA